jgi:UDP-N-acetylglucosamine 2-epimerase (non-hydrolysing)
MRCRPNPTPRDTRRTTSKPRMTASAKVCFVVGARPNFMKVAPVYRALEQLDPAADLLLIHTGQHYDTEMSEVFIEELELPRPHVFLGIGSGSHGEQTAKALVGTEQVLMEHDPALVVVAGDVNSTLAAALAATKLRIPVAHIESGLRSFDWTMPEEPNRRLTDHLSHILFVHSSSAVANLRREGIDEGRIHLIGNTMIDSVLRHLPHAETREPWTGMGVERHQFGLVTLHRPALVDDPNLLRQTIVALVELAAELPIVFPVHPRTEARLRTAGMHRAELADRGVLLFAPMPYLDFLGLEANARFVLTDSGGVQEETSALGVPCFTLRDTTERPITVELGTNVMLGLDPARIPTLLSMIRDVDIPATPLPLWDGRAGTRAAEVVIDFLSQDAESIVASD